MTTMREILEKYLTKEQLAQLPDIDSDSYPEFILSRDGQVYYLQDLYDVNAFPAVIDDDGVIVPFYSKFWIGL